MIGIQRVVHLKKTYILKGLVPLERLFVLDEAPTKPIINPDSYEYEEYYNLGDSSDSKVIKLSKTGFSKEKDKYT